MKNNIFRNSILTGVKSYVAEPLEMVIARKLNNGEAMNDKVSLMYSSDVNKIETGTNIREDRFDIALDVKSKIEASKQLSSKMEIVKDDDENEKKIS